MGGRPTKTELRPDSKAKDDDETFKPSTWRYHTLCPQTGDTCPCKWRDRWMTAASDHSFSTSDTPKDTVSIRVNAHLEKAAISLMSLAPLIVRFDSETVCEDGGYVPLVLSQHPCPSVAVLNAQFSFLSQQDVRKLRTWLPNADIVHLAADLMEPKALCEMALIRLEMPRPLVRSNGDYCAELTRKSIGLSEALIRSGQWRTLKSLKIMIPIAQCEFDGLCRAATDSLIINEWNVNCFHLSDLSALKRLLAQPAHSIQQLTLPSHDGAAALLETIQSNECTRIWDIKLTDWSYPYTGGPCGDLVLQQLCSLIRSRTGMRIDWLTVAVDDPCRLLRVLTTTPHIRRRSFLLDLVTSDPSSLSRNDHVFAACAAMMQSPYLRVRTQRLTSQRTKWLDTGHLQLCGAAWKRSHAHRANWMCVAVLFAAMRADPAIGLSVLPLIPYIFGFAKDLCDHVKADPPSIRLSTFVQSRFFNSGLQESWAS